jgi:hypothetical protein
LPVSAEEGFSGTILIVAEKMGIIYSFRYRQRIVFEPV